MKTIFYGHDNQDTITYWNDPALNIVDNVLATVEQVKEDWLAGYREHNCFTDDSIEWAHTILKECKLPDDASIMEIGSGGGRMIITLDMLCKKYGYNWKLTGVEHSQNGVDVSRVRLPEREFICMSGMDIPPDDRRFDLIYSYTCLQHNSGWKQDIILDAIYKTLKPGGLYLMFNESTFTTDNFSDTYFTPYSPWFHDIRESAGSPAWWISRLADHWFELRYFATRGTYIFKRIEKIDGKC